MANAEDVQIVRAGSPAIEARRRSKPDEFLDLCGADLARLNLSRAYLRGALLSRADLSGSDLSGADLIGATLARANLTSAVLMGAKLDGATFYGAVTTGIVLSSDQAKPSTDILSGAELIWDVEKTIVAAIRRTFPADWKEDIITYEILRSLRETFSYIKVAQMRRRNSIRWMPYKLSGAAERRFGDIAVLVHFDDLDGIEIEGVGFLEAKRRYTKTNAFDQLRVSQVNAILQHAPNARLLLYDYNQIGDYTDYQLSSGFYMRVRELASAGDFAIQVVERVTPFSGIFQSQAIAVPMSLVQAIALNQEAFCRFGTPMTHQLVLRYLNGLDLEFGASQLAIAKGWMPSVGGPRYVMTIDLSGPDREPHWRPDLNPELYQPLTRNE